MPALLGIEFDAPTVTIWQLAPETTNLVEARLLPTFFAGTVVVSEEGDAAMFFDRAGKLTTEAARCVSGADSPSNDLEHWRPLGLADRHKSAVDTEEIDEFRQPWWRGCLHVLGLAARIGNLLTHVFYRIARYPRSI